MMGKLRFGAQRGLDRQDHLAGNVCDPCHCNRKEVSNAGRKVRRGLLSAPASAGLEMDPILTEIELPSNGSSDTASNKRAQGESGLQDHLELSEDLNKLPPQTEDK